jgi:hypothetical protein
MLKREVKQIENQGYKIWKCGQLTLMTAPKSSTRSMRLKGMSESSFNCFFKVLYFSSMFNLRPYLTGTDPSNFITAKKRGSVSKLSPKWFCHRWHPLMTDMPKQQWHLHCIFTNNHRCENKWSTLQYYAGIAPEKVLNRRGLLWASSEIVNCF